MKIPKSLKIGGHKWRVIQVDAEVLGGDDCYGDQNHATNTIRLRKDMDDGQKIATFIHEIIHCINLEMEEVEVDYMAQAIYQILKENKLIKI